MYRRAFVVSLSLHVLVFAALLSIEPAPSAPPPRPVELELVFKTPEARRAPPPAPAKQASGTPGPRRTSRPRAAPPPLPVATPTALPVTDQPATVGVPIAATVGDPFAPRGPGGGDGTLDAGDTTPRATPPEPHPARLLSLPRVDYPERARLDEIEGVVRLQVDLDAQGHVTNVQVLDGPSPILEAAAREALLRAKFTPATRGGAPEPTRFEYRYRFELR